MAVHLETNDHVGIIVIDRPEKRNAVDLDTLQTLLDVQTRASNEGCRVLMVRGTPPAFCSGADLDGAELGEFTDVLARVLRGFVDWPGITVACVDGAALGAGLQIAASCDVRIATHASTFGIPAAKLGLAVDAWTVERLVRELGWSIARSMLLTGDAVVATDLYPGFVSQLMNASSGDEALAEAISISSQWATRAPLTIRAHKIALDGVAGAGMLPSDVERARLTAWASEDASEGRAAFRERRPPEFRGR